MIILIKKLEMKAFSKIILLAIITLIVTTNGQKPEENRRFDPREKFSGIYFPKIF